MAVLTSRMAAAVAALYGLAEASSDLADAVVTFGPFSDAESSTWTAAKRLAVGATEVGSDDETVAVDGDQNFRTLGARLRDEQFIVHLVAEGWNGDDDLMRAMTDCAAVVAVVETLIRPTAAAPAAHTLGGAVNMWAGFGREEMVLDRNESGAYCRISFGVACRVNLTNS